MSRVAVKLYIKEQMNKLNKARTCRDLWKNYTGTNKYVLIETK